MSESLRDSPRAVACCALLLTSAAWSAPAARLLFLEDPLRSITALERDHIRLELGSEYFGAHSWTGLRHTLRYEGTKGPVLVWSVSLPWLYSSYFDRGETGMDNLRAGLSVHHPSLPRGDLGAAGEFWLPLSQDRLYPLQQRRAFARVSVFGARRGAGISWRGSLSYRWELQGVGPEISGGRWPIRFAANLRALRALNEHWGIFVEGELSVSPDAVSWTRSGGGIQLSWAEHWRAELMGETAQGAQGDPDLYDYRVSLRLARELRRSAKAAPGEEGQTTPPSGGEGGVQEPEEKGGAGAGSDTSTGASPGDEPKRETEGATP